MQYLVMVTQGPPAAGPADILVRTKAALDEFILSQRAAPGAYIIVSTSSVFTLRKPKPKKTNPGPTNTPPTTMRSLLITMCLVAGLAMASASANNRKLLHLVGPVYC